MENNQNIFSGNILFFKIFIVSFAASLEHPIIVWLFEKRDSFVSFSKFSNFLEFLKMGNSIVNVLEFTLFKN